MLAADAVLEQFQECGGCGKPVSCFADHQGVKSAMRRCIPFPCSLSMPITRCGRSLGLRRVPSATPHHATRATESISSTPLPFAQMFINSRAWSIRSQSPVRARCGNPSLFAGCITQCTFQETTDLSGVYSVKQVLERGTKGEESAHISYPRLRLMVPGPRPAKTLSWSNVRSLLPA